MLYSSGEAGVDVAIESCLEAGRENAWGFRYRGLIGIIVLLPAGLITLLSKPAIQSPLLDLVWGWAAWTAFSAGAGFRVWSTLYIGCRKRANLVTVGPYFICRNPLYVGSFLLALSAGLFLRSLFLMAAVGFVAMGYCWATVPAEERVLRATHGSAYDEYCRRTWRFWPRFSSFRTPDGIEVKVHGLKIEAKRALVWIWLPFLGQLLSYLRVQPWWPSFLFLP